jgi:hypothetical protein
MANKKNAGAKTFGKPLTDDPDDAPEPLSDFFRHGELRRGGQLIRRDNAELVPQAALAGDVNRSRAKTMPQKYLPGLRPSMLRPGRFAARPFDPSPEIRS